MNRALGNEVGTKVYFATLLGGSRGSSYNVE